MLKILFNTADNDPLRPNNLQRFHLMTLPTNHFLLSAQPYTWLIPYQFHPPNPCLRQGPLATLLRHSPGMLQSTPPLERSTHLEAIKHTREEKKEGDDVTLLPVRISAWISAR